MKFKIHEAYRKVVAIADSELIGHTFEEGIKEIVVKPKFFDGEKVTHDNAVKILKDLDKEDATFNIVGNKSVKAAIEAGIIEESGIIKIDNIPIALGLL